MYKRMQYCLNYSGTRFLSTECWNYSIPDGFHLNTTLWHETNQHINKVCSFYEALILFSWIWKISPAERAEWWWWWWWVKCIVRKPSNKYIHLEWSLFQELLSMVCLMQYRKATEIMHYSWMESSAPDKQRSNILNNIDNCIIYNLQHRKGVDFSNLTPLKNEQKWSVVFNGVIFSTITSIHSMFFHCY